MTFKFRVGNNKDKDWLFSLYVSTLKIFVEKTWGWNEGLQRDSFSSNLHPKKFIIVMDESEKIGAYVLIKKKDHCWLEMLMVTPERQRQGVGKRIMGKIISDSNLMEFPIGLSVMKINPVISFYTAFGFSVYEEDNEIVKLIRTYNNQIKK
jgi:N-acetylglutamate synthase-like GNAT family acetyltransferase